MLEETFRREYSPEHPFLSNVQDILLVVRGMIRQEPVFSIKHLFSSHMLHHFMKYISNPYVQDFYTSLLDPYDHQMNLTQELRQHVYKYAYQTSLLINMSRFMLHPATDLNLDKYSKKFKYDAKKQIGKIKEPYLRPENFSFKISKPDYFDLQSGMEGEGEVYIGTKDIDRMGDF